MIEIIAKFSEVLKSSGLPLFILTAFGSTKKPEIKEEQSTIIEDEALGDNFPYFTVNG